MMERLYSTAGAEPDLVRFAVLVVADGDAVLVGEGAQGQGSARPCAIPLLPWPAGSRAVACPDGDRLLAKD